MRRGSVLVLAALMTAGCTHTILRNSTRHQAATLTDLQYQQVLDNLALQAACPGALPYFAVTALGLTQVSDTGTSMDSVIPNNGIRGLTSGIYNITSSRTLQENWTVVPVMDPDRLDRMRCLYQLALGLRPSGPDDHCAELEAFFGGHATPVHVGGPAEPAAEAAHAQPCLARAVPTGWFCVGPKHKVPWKACYVGRYGRTYVWVMRDGVEDLSRFTLSVLDIATAVGSGAHVRVAPLPTVPQGAIPIPANR
jgi:hypothetical protein